MRRMFDPFEKMARQNHSCPCCERGFSLEEEDNFVKKVGGFDRFSLNDWIFLAQKPSLSFAGLKSVIEKIEKKTQTL